jgi:methionyl-tRNA formyltransferase
MQQGLAKLKLHLQCEGAWGTCVAQAFRDYGPVTDTLPDWVLQASDKESLPRLASRWGTLRLHLGQLPEYQGATPLAWTLLNNESQTRLNSLLLPAEPSAREAPQNVAPAYKAPIVHSQALPIQAQQTWNEVAQAAAQVAVQQVELLLQRWQQHHELFPMAQLQSPHRQRLYGAFRPGTLIDWHHLTAQQVVNWVRACQQPARSGQLGGAQAVVGEERYTLLKARVCPERSLGHVGQWLPPYQGVPCVMARDRGVLLLNYQQGSV